MPTAIGIINAIIGRQRPSVARRILYLFRNRVLAAAGVIEATACFLNYINDLYKTQVSPETNAYNEADIITTANAYDAGIIFSAKPTSGDVDIDFARTTSAYRTTSAQLLEQEVIDTPLLDFDKGGCPSFAFWPSKTNILVQSEDFASGAYGIVGLAIVSNSIAFLDGRVVADRVVESNLLELHRLFRIPLNTVTNGETYTISIYFKPNGRGIYFNDDNQSSSYLAVNSSGAIVRQGGTVASGVKAYANGWFRAWFRYVKTNTGARPNYYLYDGVSASNPPAYLGDDASGIYICGAQEELRDLTSYIPTTAAAATRALQSALKTGVSANINSVENTIYFDGEVFSATTLVTLVSYSDGTVNNIIALEVNASGQIQASITIGGAPPIVLIGIAVAANTRFRAALTFKANEYKLFLNGVLRDTDLTGGAFPAATLSRKGYDGYTSSVNPFLGRLYQDAIENLALTQSEAINLTS